MLSSIFISITVNLRDRLWRRSDKVIHRTVSKTGEKTVKIRTTGNEKNRLTVVLTCAGDGSKLKPLVIFKRKTMPKIANKHGVVVAVADDSLVSESDFEGF